MATLKSAPKTQLTVELSTELVEQLNNYLVNNPGETLENMLREALRIRTPKDTSSLLKLAGIVKDAPHGASEHAEDHID